MLLDSTGFKVDQWDQTLLRVLGEAPGEEGAHVLFEAVSRGCSRVDVRHWLYCLVKHPKGLLRQQLVDPTRKPVEEFIAVVEKCSSTVQQDSGRLLEKLTADVVTPGVMKMLERAEDLIKRRGIDTVNEAALTLAILEPGNDKDELLGILKSWAREDGFKRCKAVVNARIVGAPEKLAREDLFRGPLLGSRDVGNWPGLCTKLFELGRAPGDSVGKRLWGMLSPQVQQAVCNAVGTGHFDAIAGLLRPAINEVLRQKNLCMDQGLKDPAAATGELNLVKANRRQLEAAFPQIIASAGTADGRLVATLFDASGRRLCKRFREDMASLGVTKVTTYHLLYTLLGTESLLSEALSMRGIDVKKDLHTALSRRLVKPGTKRNEGFELDEQTLMSPVVDIFLHSAGLAHVRGRAEINEADLSRAFLSRSPNTLQELFSRDKPLELQTVRDYMDSVEVREEEEKAITRLSATAIQEQINGRIRGQSKAVAQILPWIKRLRFGLRRDNRPAAVLLFLGPTGTGKTQMAKELARFVFGDEDQLIFLEMGQFQTKESMNGFVGAPPGYVGYGEGKLTNGLRDKPESVVLFDEIEKAYIEVFNALLRFSDEGLISDPAGPVRDGTKCIIVMTTNAGQQWLLDEYLERDKLSTADDLARKLADACEDASLPERFLKAAQDELKERGFRPEFIGRIDERVVFLPLNLDACRQIVKDVLDAERRRLMELRGFDLVVEEDALEELAKTAMTRSLDQGARGVPRTLNEYVIGPMIDEVFAGEEKGQICRRLRVITDTGRGLGVGSIKVEVE